MSEQTSRPNPIIEQVGEPLTMDDLPPPNIKRGITRRKAEVVTIRVRGDIDPNALGD